VTSQIIKVHWLFTGHGLFTGQNEYHNPKGNKQTNQPNQIPTEHNTSIFKSWKTFHCNHFPVHSFAVECLTTKLDPNQKMRSDGILGNRNEQVIGVKGTTSKRIKWLKRRERWLVVLGVILHAIYMLSIFDIYFKSPIVHGVDPVPPRFSAPAKRLVLLVGMCAPLSKYPHSHSRTPTVWCYVYFTFRMISCCKIFIIDI
jgi:hypothetical protein